MCRLDNPPCSCTCSTPGCHTRDGAPGARKIDPIQDAALISQILAIGPNGPALVARRSRRTTADYRPASVLCLSSPSPIDTDAVTHTPAPAPPTPPPPTLPPWPHPKPALYISRDPAPPTPPLSPAPTISHPKPAFNISCDPTPALVLPAVILDHPDSPSLISEGQLEHLGCLLFKHCELNVCITPGGCIIPLVLSPSHRLYLPAYAVPSDPPDPTYPTLVIGPAPPDTDAFLIQLDDAADVSVLPPSLSTHLRCPRPSSSPVKGLTGPLMPTSLSGELHLRLSPLAPRGLTPNELAHAFHHHIPPYLPIRDPTSPIVPNSPPVSDPAVQILLTTLAPSQPPPTPTLAFIPPPNQ